MRALADYEARRVILEDHASTLVVEAAAGTGKTTALVTRLIAMLRAGVCELDRVVAVTFTDKAAGELTLRIRTALESAIGGPEGIEQQRCIDALSALETARISTIHGFCSDILRERPIEAGVDPDFSLLSDSETDRLLDRACTECFEEVLADPPEGLRRWIRRSVRRDESTRDRIRQALRTLIEHRDQTQPWRRDVFHRDAAIDEMMEMVDELAVIAQRCANLRDPLRQSLEGVIRLSTDRTLREQTAPRDYDGLEAALVELRIDRKKRGSARNYGPGTLRSDVVTRRARLHQELETFSRLADADLAACIKSDLRGFAERYQELKARAGALDYLDLLIEVRDLLRDNRETRAELQERYTHLFVDEVQDTDPIQIEIMLLLASGELDCTDPSRIVPRAGKLFIVGDPKQSIYRFRRADIANYELFKEQLLRGGAQLVHLTSSFRSRPAICHAINRAFASSMQPSVSAPHLQADYVPLTPVRDAIETRPSVVALAIPRPYSLSNPNEIHRGQTAESAIDAVAGFAHWLLRDSGWSVEEDGHEVPVAPHHVCLLFRRGQAYSKDIFWAYARALEARAIPHSWSSGRSLHEREEVGSLRAILTAIEYPEDPLAIYAALHGPFFAFDDVDLLMYRDQVGGLYPLRKTDQSMLAEPLQPIGRALESLRELHFDRNQVPVAETIHRVLDQTRAYASLALAHGGEQVLASVLRVVDMARRFDQRGALSFRAFVELLEDQAARGDAGDLPATDDSESGVRLLTVHRAKGLEFPVVILCDPMTSSHTKPDQWIDVRAGAHFTKLAGLAPIELYEHEDRALESASAEEIRLTYVAATRARELLVIPAVGEGPASGWLAPLERGIYPSRSAWRSSEDAPGCPRFGEDSILDSPSGGGQSVRPGRHRLDEAELVWWDPGALMLGVETPDGVRDDDLLRRTPGVEDGASAYAWWREERTRALEDGALESLVKVSARELARTSFDALEPVETTRLESASGLVTGRRADALLRSVMALCDRPCDLDALVRSRARALGSDSEEITRVSSAMRALFSQRSWADAERMIPICAPRDQGGVLRGTIDVIDQDCAIRVMLGETASEASCREIAMLTAAHRSATGRPIRAGIWLV